jgi:DNA helicase-2/ATP-dependent DNA helicase PcrA
MTQRSLKKKSVYQEDLAPLVWIHNRFHGGVGLQLDHVVVDEAQDVSPFQIALLRSCMHEPSMTILGDLAQGIHSYKGVQRWEEISALFEPEQTAYHELKQSYRSTLEIIEFANTLLPYTETGLPPAQPVFRSGDPVNFIRIEQPQDRVRYIARSIEESRVNGMNTFAVIGRTEEDCARLYAEFQAHELEVHLLQEGQSAYKGGTSIVPVHLSKGLEFDAVILMDVDPSRYTRSPHDAKLLYVGCTRALHRLTLMYGDALSPLVQSIPVTV